MYRIMLNASSNFVDENPRCKDCGSEIGRHESVYYNSNTDEQYCYNCILRRIVGAYPFLSSNELTDDFDLFYNYLEKLGFEEIYD